MFKKLRKLYFRLHEVELELDAFEEQESYAGIDDYEYIQTIKARKEELIKEINDILYAETESKD